MNPQASAGAGREIRVLLVDDSPLSIELIRRMLAPAPDIRVVGTAGNGAEALELIPKVRPDVICSDLHMPRVDGLALTREIMARQPIPLLILSVSVQADQEHNIFRMLEAGALDVLAKPRGGLESDLDATAEELIRKIRILSGVKLIGRRRATEAAVAAAPPHSLARTAATAARIIGIGASTGGPQALDLILRLLPANFPLPLLCVQHIAKGFMSGLVAWLARSCQIRVRTVEEGEGPQPGTAYFPADERHVEIDATGRFRLSEALCVSGHRPSVDVAFGSIARSYGAAAVGVLLTGMGQDGALGMLDIARAGGHTIAQDEESSVVFGMPRRAIELAAVRQVLPLAQIGPALCELAANPALRTDPAGVTQAGRS